MELDFFKNNINFVLDELVRVGPVYSETMEFLSQFKFLYPEEFSTYEKQVLKLMGLFYKTDLFDDDEENYLFKDYSDSILDLFKKRYTPIQSNIRNNILNNEYFFFSAPTSSGKSYIMKDLLYECNDNAVVIVPTRALINEYISDIYAGLKKENITDFNVLQYVEKVNVKYTPKTIFVLTPERCLDLFKKELNISLFIFDEAQLIDKKEGIRSLKYKMIIKKINDNYKNAKKLFAYPFVDNVDCMITSQIISSDNYSCAKYDYKSIGQFFVEHNEDKKLFSIISINDNKRSIVIDDPIEYALKNEKSILVYTSKSKIYNGKIYSFLKPYIEACELETSQEALNLIRKVEEHIGANEDRQSELVYMMKYGVVIHHGSLPQEIRRYIEEFIRKGYSKICISTTTLLQGVNMPFDIVYIYEWYNLGKSIDFKNLIGRAGRSSVISKFDYGMVIVRDKNKLKRKMVEKVVVDPSDYEPKTFEEADIKDALLSGDIDEETNLPKEIINKISTEEMYSLVNQIALCLFDDRRMLRDIEGIDIGDLVSKFAKIYEKNLHNRSMTDVEYRVFSNAVFIMILKIYGFKFKDIVIERYIFATRNNWNLAKADVIPNQREIILNLFANNSNKDAFFDLVVYDTYEYIDKVINMCIKDIFIAAVIKTKNVMPSLLLDELYKYLQYYSADENAISLYRYGFDEDEIEEIKEHVILATSECIIFRNSINTIDFELYEKVQRYIYDDNVV